MKSVLPVLRRFSRPGQESRNRPRVPPGCDALPRVGCRGAAVRTVKARGTSQRASRSSEVVGGRSAGRGGGGFQRQEVKEREREREARECGTSCCEWCAIGDTGGSKGTGEGGEAGRSWTCLLSQKSESDIALPFSRSLDRIVTHRNTHPLILSETDRPERARPFHAAQKAKQKLNATGEVATNAQSCFESPIGDAACPARRQDRRRPKAPPPSPPHPAVCRQQPRDGARRGSDGGTGRRGRSGGGGESPADRPLALVPRRRRDQRQL